MGAEDKCGTTCHFTVTFLRSFSPFKWVVTVNRAELEKRVKEMEALLEMMELRYNEMLRDNRVLKAELERLKRENSELKGEGHE